MVRGEGGGREGGEGGEREEGWREGVTSGEGDQGVNRGRGKWRPEGKGLTSVCVWGGGWE